MYRKLALKILNRVRSNYARPHTYRQVDASAFRHLSLRFYDETQKKLESLGFKYIADFEDELLKTQSPDPRTFIRVMTSNDGVAGAGIFQICPNIFWKVAMYFFGVKNTRIVEFQSELEGGYQVITSNVQGRFMMPSSPKLYRTFYPAVTPLDALYDAHRRILDEARKNTGKAPVEFKTLKDILEFENRQNEIQKEYLKSIGWITKEYLVKQGATGDNAQAIYNEIQNILREEAERETFRDGPKPPVNAPAA